MPAGPLILAWLSNLVIVIKKKKKKEPAEYET